MKNSWAYRRIGEKGLSVWSVLVFLIFIALIVLVVMKAVSVLTAIGVFVVAAILIGLAANAGDIGRYIKISGM